MIPPTIRFPELPPPGEQTPDDYLQLSRRAVEQSRIELAAGDRVQASEKVSGAVATALKAIAEQRGWRHDSHPLRDAVVSQLGAELGPSTPPAQILYRGRDAAKAQHRNFYENTLYEDDILESIAVGEAFVQAIARLMSEPPRPFTVAKPLDRHRIVQLTRFAPDLGVTDARGFANFNGEVRQE